MHLPQRISGRYNKFIYFSPHPRRSQGSEVDVIVKGKLDATI
jgi:hypothetical protein